MLKVALASFFFIILAELALDTILLLRQLVFCTYILFETVKIHYDYDRVIIALDFGSYGRGFDSHHLIFLCKILFLITIFMVFFHPNVS